MTCDMHCAGGTNTEGHREQGSAVGISRLVAPDVLGDTRKEL